MVFLQVNSIRIKNTKYCLRVSAYRFNHMHLDFQKHQLSLTYTIVLQFSIMFGLHTIVVHANCSPLGWKKPFAVEVVDRDRACVHSNSLHLE